MVQQDEPAASDKPSPGALLREAREKAGMTIEQVAEKLHLLKSVVTSLEKDCYDRIRGDTFVRGYMRNYARLLGIDSDEVIGRYNSRSGSGKAESRFGLRRESSHGPSGAGRVGMIAVLLSMSGALLGLNRPAVDAGTDDSLATSANLTIETAGGEKSLGLGSELR